MPKKEYKCFRCGKVKMKYESEVVGNVYCGGECAKKAVQERAIQAREDNV